MRWLCCSRSRVKMAAIKKPHFSKYHYLLWRGSFKLYRQQVALRGTVP